MVIIDGNSLDLEKVISVARDMEKVEISPDAIENVRKSHETLLKIIDSDRVAYGIKTGFGDLQNVIIPDSEVRSIQRNIVLSHAVGVGKPFSTDVVRASMLIRANALAKGFSGIRPSVLNTLIDMLNRGVHPVMPEKGSVGASGDLAPLAHMALVMIGRGEAEYLGEILPGKTAMERAGIDIIELEAKEGLALLNGTPVMNAMAALAVYDSENIVTHAHIAASMSLEALQGITSPFDTRVHDARPHRGQIRSAELMRKLLEGSEIAKESSKTRVQDAYTLRCIPPVMGAVMDTIDYVKGIVETEMNSTTDNPLIFPNGDSISCGNFHGEPLALAMDFLKIALTDLGNMSERRIARLVDSHLSGLPSFLTEKSGLNSGFMLAQYLTASLASENKVFSHPSSVDTIPTSANQEDHVSMGANAGRHLLQVVENVETIIAVELMAAAQGLELLGKTASPANRLSLNTIRKNIPHLNDDREMYYDIKKSVELIRSMELSRSIQKSVKIKI